MKKELYGALLGRGRIFSTHLFFIHIFKIISNLTPESYIRREQQKSNLHSFSIEGLIVGPGIYDNRSKKNMKKAIDSSLPESMFLQPHL